MCIKFLAKKLLKQIVYILFLQLTQLTSKANDAPQLSQPETYFL